MTPGILLALSLPDVVYEILRVVAAILGALGGWFIGAPLARGLVRLAFQRRLPQGGQIVSRFLAAGLACALIYFYLPLGPGEGGGGSGSGGGIGEGTGPGTAGSTQGDPRKPGADKGTRDKVKIGKLIDIPADGLPIEVLGGTRQAGRFYRVLGKEMNLDEVDDYLGNNKERWKKVYIVLDDNAPVELPGGPRPISNLKDLVVSRHEMLWREVHRK